MVLTVTAPLWSDVSDRAARLLGIADVSDSKDRHVGFATVDRCGGFLGSDWHGNLLNTNYDSCLDVYNVPWWARFRPGRVMHMDDMEGTLGWIQSTGTVTKDATATHVHSGTSSLKLLTGNAAGNPAAAQMFCGSPIVDPGGDFIVLSFWWQLQAAADNTPRDFYFTILFEDKTLNSWSLLGIRYYNYDGGVLKRKPQYWNNAGVWTDFPGAPITRRTEIVNPMFNYWELVIKRSNSLGYQYWELRWDEIIYNTIQTLNGQTGAYAIPHSEIVLGCTTDAAFATTAWVDDLALIDIVFDVDRIGTGP